MSEIWLWEVRDAPTYIYSMPDCASIAPPSTYKLGGKQNFQKGVCPIVIILVCVQLIKNSSNTCTHTILTGDICEERKNKLVQSTSIRGMMSSWGNVFIRIFETNDPVPPRTRHSRNRLPWVLWKYVGSKRLLEVTETIRMFKSMTILWLYSIIELF